MKALIHLAHTAFAPPYGTLFLSAEQLTGHMTGFEHFTETFCNYIYYYSTPEAICLIFTWAHNKSLFPTTACTKSTTWF